MILTAVTKLFKEGQTISKNVNEKRVVISLVSIVVGCGYAFGLSKYHQALSFSLTTLLFMVVLISINHKKGDFFIIKNLVMIIV
jgi:hypothetical protein